MRATCVRAAPSRRRDSNSRILLAATAENYSADIFCDCLRRAGVGTDVMVRVNDPRWPMARTMESILLYCLLDVKPAPNGASSLACPRTSQAVCNYLAHCSAATYHTWLSIMTLPPALASVCA